MIKRKKRRKWKNETGRNEEKGKGKEGGKAKVKFGYKFWRTPSIKAIKKRGFRLISFTPSNLCYRDKNMEKTEI